MLGKVQVEVKGVSSSSSFAFCMMKRGMKKKPYSCVKRRKQGQRREEAKSGIKRRLNRINALAESVST